MNVEKDVKKFSFSWLFWKLYFKKSTTNRDTTFMTSCLEKEINFTAEKILN